MRHRGIAALGTLGVAVWLTGCGSPAPSQTPTSVAPTTTPTAVPASAVNILVTGADTAHLVSSVAVPCSGGVGNEGQNLLGVALDTAKDPMRGNVALNLTIVGFKSTGTYKAAAVWAADGATSVTLDPDPNGAISEERFVAQSGTVTVTSAQGMDFAGSIDATLIPESPTTPSAQVQVNGTWSCQE
jgi:hypothetical protein